MTAKALALLGVLMWVAAFIYMFYAMSVGIPADAAHVIPAMGTGLLGEILFFGAMGRIL
jgi:hypothetical protein